MIKRNSSGEVGLVELYNVSVDSATVVSNKDLRDSNDEIIRFK